MGRRRLSSGQTVLVVIVVTGTVVISLIGFVGSYDAVLRLAQRNGFGWFSYLLPVGIDVGITVFLALDLLLTWMGIALPVLRQLAWLLTGATIVFNAASAWPRPLASGMHAVVPLLFVAAIEAARHTVGRLAQIEAGRLFERTRLGRWIFAPVATVRLLRRRMLWELRSYEEALEAERRRLVYRARLRASYGRLWRYRAPVDMVLLLRLANLGEPLPEFKLDAVFALPGTATVGLPATQTAVKALLPQPREERCAPGVVCAGAEAAEAPDEASSVPQPQPAPEAAVAERFGSASAAASAPVQVVVHASRVAVATPEQVAAPAASAAEPTPWEGAETLPAVPLSGARSAPAAPRSAAASKGGAVDRFRLAFNDYTQRHGAFPDGDQLAKWLFERYGITGRSGEALSPGHLRRYLPRFKAAWDTDQECPPGTPE